MKNKFIIIVVAIIAVLLGIILIFNDDKESYLKEISVEELQTMIENKKDFILYIKQTNCSHCQEFQPNYVSVLNKYKVYSYVINLTDIDKDSYSTLVDITGVEGTPTVYFFEDGEKSSTTIEGAKPKDVITNKLKVMGYIKEEN